MAITTNKTNMTLLLLLAIILLGSLGIGISGVHYNPIYLTDNTSSTRIEFVNTTGVLYITNGGNVSITNNERTAYQTLKAGNIYSNDVLVCLSNGTNCLTGGNTTINNYTSNDGNNYTTSINVTGTSSKRLNLSRLGLLDLTADWTDYDTDTDDQTLNEIGDPIASKDFSMGGNTLTWTFTNPVGGMLWNLTGGWSGHVLEIMDSSAVPTGTPGDHLIHVQSSRKDVIAGHFKQTFTGTGLRVDGGSVLNGTLNLSDGATLAVLASAGCDVKAYSTNGTLYCGTDVDTDDQTCTEVSGCVEGAIIGNKLNYSDFTTQNSSVWDNLKRNTMVGWSNSSTAVYLNDTTDYVGIGVVAPSNELHIYSTAVDALDDAAILLTTPNTGTTFTDGFYLGITDTDKKAWVWNFEVGDLAFGTSGTEYVTLNASGSLGIGTTLPKSLLQVAGRSNTSLLTIANLTSVNCDVKADLSGNIYCGTDATGSGGNTSAEMIQATEAQLDQAAGWLNNSVNVTTALPIALTGSTLYVSSASQAGINLAGTTARAYFEETDDDDWSMLVSNGDFYFKQESGANEFFRVRGNDNVDVMVVDLAGRNIIFNNSIQIASLTAASCDVKAYTNGTLYCGTDATGSGSTSVSNFVTAQKTSNTLMTSTLLFTFNLTASKNYYLECNYLVMSVATTTGQNLNASCNGAPTLFNATAIGYTSTPAPLIVGTNTCGGAGLILTGVYSTSLPTWETYIATIRNSGSSKQINLTLGSEVATSATYILPNSKCVLEQLD